MKWTVEQIAEMRIGRPAHRDTDQGTALAWIRTGQDTSHVTTDNSVQKAPEPVRFTYDFG